MKKNVKKVSVKIIESRLAEGVWVCEDTKGPAVTFLIRDGSKIKAVTAPLLRDSAIEKILAGVYDGHVVAYTFRVDDASFEDADGQAVMLYSSENKEAAVLSGKDIPIDIIKRFKEEELFLLDIRPRQ